MGSFDHLAKEPEPATAVPPGVDPGSFQHLLGHPKEGVTGNKEPADTRSDTEKRLTADNLRRLLATGGDSGKARTLSELITGSEHKPDSGSMLERSTDWVIPGIKNTMGGVLSLGRELVTGDGTPGEAWRAGVNAEKQYRDQNREATNNPLGWAADAAGIVASGGKAGGPFAGAGAARGPVGQGAPVVDATAKSAVTLPKAVQIGATQGAISGAAENSQDLGSAAQGAVVGGGTGAAVSAGAHTLQGLIGRFVGNKAKAAAAAERQGQRGPDPDVRAAEAKGIFGQLDNAGVAWDQSQTKRIAGKLQQTLQNAGYDRTLNKDLQSIVDDLANIGTRKEVTFGGIEGLDSLRSRISAGMRSANANDRRVAGHLAGLVDDFIDTQTPAINRTGADVGKLYTKAREAYRTHKLAEATENIEGVAERTTENLGARTARSAEDRASTAVTQNLNRVQKRGEHNPLNPEQQAAAEQVSRGSPWQNRLEGINELSKDWKTNAMVGAGAGGVLSSITGWPFQATGPIAAALGGLGSKGVSRLTKGAADSIARDNMDELVRAIMTGTRDKPASWEMPRDLLASLMATRGTHRAAGQAIPDSVMNKRFPHSNDTDKDDRK
jgi:hypothetical protein